MPAIIPLFVGPTSHTSHSPPSNFSHHRPPPASRHNRWTPCSVPRPRGRSRHRPPRRRIKKLSASLPTRSAVITKARAYFPRKLLLVESFGIRATRMCRETPSPALRPGRHRKKADEAHLCGLLAPGQRGHFHREKAGGGTNSTTRESRVSCVQKLFLSFCFSSFFFCRCNHYIPGTSLQRLSSFLCTSTGYMF